MMLFYLNLLVCLLVFHSSAKQYIALVAQWIEHLPPKERVTRSIRVEGTINNLNFDNSLHRLAWRFI